jgi:hypothetical protein
MRIPASQVPLAVRRRAAQHLEAVRETEIGVNARRARLATHVVPVRRPDRTDVAYYEFEVEPKGFIVVSAGRHDYPLPHWSFDQEPVSRRLEALAEESGKALAKLYKLDSLAYVGEDAGGQKVAQLGDLPLLVEGLPALEPSRGKIAATVAAPAAPVAHDAELNGTAHKVTHSGAKPADISLRAFQSWPELRSGYGERLRPFLAELERRAAETWAIDDLVARSGEGLMTGRPQRVALLEPQAQASLSGEAAGAVRLQRIAKPGVPPVLELSAASTPFDREATFDLTIVYGSGLTERLPFFLVAPDTPSNRRTAAEERDR